MKLKTNIIAALALAGLCFGCATAKQASTTAVNAPLTAANQVVTTTVGTVTSTANVVATTAINTAFAPLVWAEEKAKGWFKHGHKAPPGQEKKTASLTPSQHLAFALAGRDNKTVDLVEVGHCLAKNYGKKVAEQTVLNSWNELTKHQPMEKAADVTWLLDQPPRVRDVAWLVNYRAEWLGEAKGK